MEDIILVSKHAEEAGFTHIVLGESAYRDVFIELLIIANATKRIELGTNIIPIFTRTPTQIVMSTNSLNEAIGGRFTILGLGRGGPMILEPNHGIKVEKADARMKEYIEIIRPMLLGEHVSYAGEFFKIDNTWIPQTYGVGATTSELSQKGRVSIFVGCSGEKMLQIAGGYADGVIFSPISTPEYLGWAMNTVKEGAKKVGRNMEAFRFGCQILTASNDDPEKIKAGVRRALLYYLRGPQTEAITSRSGTLNTARKVREAYMRNDVESALGLIDDQIIAKHTFAGTPEQLRRKAREYARMGIELFTMRTIFDKATGTGAVLNNIDTFAPLLEERSPTT